jgi:hypothetical protein
MTFPFRTARSIDAWNGTATRDGSGDDSRVTDANPPVPPLPAPTGRVPAQLVAGWGVRAYRDDTSRPPENPTIQDHAS